MHRMYMNFMIRISKRSIWGHICYYWGHICYYLIFLLCSCLFWACISLCWDKKQLHNEWRVGSKLSSSKHKHTRWHCHYCTFCSSQAERLQWFYTFIQNLKKFGGVFCKCARDIVSQSLWMVWVISSLLYQLRKNSRFMTIKSKRQREQMMLFVLTIENSVMQACVVPLFMYFAGPTFLYFHFSVVVLL